MIHNLKPGCFCFLSRIGAQLARYMELNSGLPLQRQHLEGTVSPNNGKCINKKYDFEGKQT